MSISATYQEIVSQPVAWAAALSAVTQQASSLTDTCHSAEFDQVLFTGCGSTYYLATAAAALFQTLSGQASRAVPGGELLLYPETTLSSATERPTLLVAISRSGTTTETVSAVGQFKAQQRGPVIVITNYGDSPLALLGDVVVAIPEGQEESVAQTRSFASMYVAVSAVACHLTQHTDALSAMAALPAVGQRLIATYEPLAKQWGQSLDLDRFYFLGSGPRYGLACEVNLKMKEMTLTHSEPFHFLEFRHGPMSMVTDSAAIIGLLSDTQREHEAAVLTEMAQLGGRVLTLGETNADIAFDSGLPESIRNVLYLPILQLIAYYRAIAKQLDPDHPTHLTAVVELDFSF